VNLQKQMKTKMSQESKKGIRLCESAKANEN